LRILPLNHLKKVINYRASILASWITIKLLHF
jgi:hypothetical protein